MGTHVQNCKGARSSKELLPTYTRSVVYNLEPCANEQCRYVSAESDRCIRTDPFFGSWRADTEKCTHEPPCPGAPEEQIDRDDTVKDGKLQTWLHGPGFVEPLLVVDKQDMGWRMYNNVSIDTLYFSVFFGGSSPSFQARKDEVRKRRAACKCYKVSLCLLAYGHSLRR